MPAAKKMKNSADFSSSAKTNFVTVKLTFTANANPVRQFSDFQKQKENTQLFAQNANLALRSEDRFN